MDDWIMLAGHRAINLAQVQDIEFHIEPGDARRATLRLASFNPTTGDRLNTTWFSVTGADLERLQACIARRLAPEFDEEAGYMGRAGRQPDHSRD